jgi:hypothetical protein
MSRIGSVLLLVTACAPAPDVPARPPLPGELLVAQLYTSGAAPAGGTDHYFSDQFIELVNAAADPLDLSGVRIANVHGAAGEINPGMEPDSFREALPEQVVMSSVWRLPEGVRLEPGASLFIAHDGANHRPFSGVDLSGADFEAYVEESGRDDDHPTVANLERVAFNGGFDWLMTVFGPSVVVLDAEAPLDEVPGPFGPLPTVSADAVLDGVDTVMDAESGAYKRLPDRIDRGFAVAEGPYTGTALHRLEVGGLYLDTGDSSVDFLVGPPDTSRPTRTDGVFGDPIVEIGTGQLAWEPLASEAPIELVAGIQGGWHLDASLWFDGFGPGGVTVTYDAVDTNAERVSFTTQAVLTEDSVIEAEPGWHRVGDRIVLDIDAPEDVVGRTLIVRATATLDGLSWSDERRVVVVDER